MNKESDIEIRPCFGIEDFAESDPSGKLMESERELYTTIENMSADEAEIRHMMHEWSRSLELKDVDALVKDYAPDAVLYDAIPPCKTVGTDNIRQVWENCLPYFPEKFKSEHSDIQIHVAGDTAFAHCLHRFVPRPADHPCGQTWMRVTIGYRKFGGKWKVVREHVSIPFNPTNNQSWLITVPFARTTDWRTQDDWCSRFKIGVIDQCEHFLTSHFITVFCATLDGRDLPRCMS